MPYKLEGTWQPADYAPDEICFLKSYQKRRALERWLSSRSPEDKERYRLEKEREDREITDRNSSREGREMNEKMNMEERIRSCERARGDIERKRGTPWDKERKDLDEAMQNWIREEESEEAKKVENERQWNRNLRSATRFRGAKSSEKIQASMKSEQETRREVYEEERIRRKGERIAKFEVMAKAEADRWTEELSLANAASGHPFDETSESRLGLVHRDCCMPQTYTSTSRHNQCADCRDDEEIARIQLQERREMERRRLMIMLD
ncbi:hypothetical protein EAE96_007783 [Botrytis aclada]|nr:hypothetical protein EAE96_007783 [Botrytis aclada]